VHTGAQSEKKRKAGSRITNANAFGSGGKALNDGVISERKDAGTGFRKKAGRYMFRLSNSEGSCIMVG
jgi:hypothetical protein